MNVLLQQGIAAARAGRREEARALLQQVIEVEERNEAAWMWLAGVLDDPEEMRICLENVLELNPGNTKAREGLGWINQRYGPPPPVSLSAPAPPINPTPAGGKAVTEVTGSLSLAMLPPEADERTTAQPQPTLATPVMVPDAPCPYCGAATALEDQVCAQCHKSLMMSDNLPTRRSFSTTVLAGVVLFTAALHILVVVGIGSELTNLAGAQASQDQSQMNVLVLEGVAIALNTGLLISSGLGLLQLQRWAFYLCTTATALVAAEVIYKLIQLPTAISTVMQPAFSNTFASAIIFIVLLIVDIIVLITLIVLIVMSYPDFFSQKVRILPMIKAVDSLSHYNNGIRYKQQGMWYMAVKEWEAAVLKVPNNEDYLHALGLAYAQIRQFDLARTTLDRAQEINPYNLQLKESRALIDQMSSKWE